MRWDSVIILVNGEKTGAFFMQITLKRGIKQGAAEKNKDSYGSLIHFDQKISNYENFFVYFLDRYEKSCYNGNVPLHTFVTIGGGLTRA